MLYICPVKYLKHPSQKRYFYAFLEANATKKNKLLYFYEGYYLNLHSIMKPFSPFLDKIKRALFPIKAKICNPKDDIIKIL